LDYDVTKHKHHHSISRSEVYPSLFEHHPDAIYILDTEGNYVDCNKSTEIITGYSREAFVAKNQDPFISPTDLNTFKSYFTLCLQGECQQFDSVYTNKDGRQIDVSITYIPIIKESHALGVYGIAKDISHFKWMEKSVGDSEAIFRLMAENMTDLIGIVDQDGIVKYASPSHLNVLGVSPDFLIGKNAFQYVNPEHVTYLQSKFIEMIENRQPIQVEFGYLHHKEGHYVTVEGRFAPTYREDDSIEYIVCVVRDISERIKTEELIRQTEKLSIAGELAAGIAHEIRNPLTAIKGFIKLMLKIENRKEKKYLEIVTSELERIELILTELLMMAKPQTTTFELMDIRDILNHVIALIETQTNMKNMQISASFEEDLPLIQASGNHLKQVFINFIQNSIDAMSDGGMIHILAKKQGAADIVIEFIDNGKGIPEALLNKLGEPFYTTKEKGTGLGLMVSRKIIQEHKGALSFDSEIGKGTKVSVVLPVWKEI
jgi:two-component system sporulation sensor kinase A